MSKTGPEIANIQNTIMKILGACSHQILMLPTDDLKSYICDSSIYTDGTLDAIFPHYMSLKDQDHAQSVMKEISKVAQALLDLQKAHNNIVTLISPRKVA